MLEAFGRHVTAVRARLPGVLLCETQVPEVLSERWYKLTQVKQEAEGFVRSSRHKCMNKVHAEQVMTRGFTGNSRRPRRQWSCPYVGTFNTRENIGRCPSRSQGQA